MRIFSLYDKINLKRRLNDKLFRYYGGNEFVDEIELLAQSRALEVTINILYIIISRLVSILVR